MGKRKNLKADKPEFTGRIIFDGNLQLRIPGHGVKTLRTDLGGMSLHRADPNKELLVLTRNFVGFDEIHTGYIVRAKKYDIVERPCFGLKRDPDETSWTVINYCDVIAWGYADGGLNDPTLFYSCQSTVAEEIDREKYRAEHGIKTHAEKLAEMDDEDEDIQKGIVFKLRQGDESIDYESSWPKDEDGKPKVPEKFVELNTAAVIYFGKIHDEHPEFREVRFYTEPTKWESDYEDTTE